MGQVNTRSGLFRVEIEGPADAPVLMLSNSLGTDLHMWDPQMPELTKRFRVVRYDSRGHGGSVAEPGPYSIAMLGRDALAIMDSLDLHKVNWCGLSMGGMVGQWLLANAPERIERAVLANTSSYMPDARPWNARIVTVQQHGMASVAQTVVDRWFTPEFQGRDPAAVERIATMLRHTPAHGYVACCAAVRDMDQRETVRRANRPTLVIAGAQDPATPPFLSKSIVESIPDAQYVELDTAHLSNIEMPEAFSRAVISFLTAPDRKAAAPKTATRKAPARKRAAKKAAPKKAAKKAAAKKAATKKAPAKKAPAKKTPAKKTPAKKTARKAAAKKAVAKKAVAKKPARKAAAKKVSKASARRTTVKKPARKATKKTTKRSAR